ncbi:MAG: hypothetical protein HC895_06405 [Leptolyngbyaceae cyanobacterium SM1_3_5]|nr:hypothetical protein [Leptolyngbyaceae cyanobacterium SM1_3_5]
MYSKAASEVTFGVIEASDVQSNPNLNGGEVYQGYAISGGVGRGGAEDSNSFGGQSIFHVQEEGSDNPITDIPGEVTFNDTRDSVQNVDRPTDYTLDPVRLLTEGISEARGNIQESRVDSAWENSSFVSRKRIYAQSEDQPNVDDSFRADNRQGPKPQYAGVPIDNQLGDNIDPARTDLLRLDPPTGGDEDDVGFDGYWERRARFQGLRLIVGQRLELGNAFGWNSGELSVTSQVNEPLRPWLDCSPNNGGNCNQARQRRSLYDNLAAVQATAVYHAKGDNATDGKDTPLACLATTVHPGTAYTLERSATFENLREYDLSSGSAFVAPFNAPTAVVNGDFFRGRGTNGWEYDASSIVPNLIDTASPLNSALRNLANYAGDPKGGAPSFKPVNTDGQVHPYPSMAMWGDFSNLRRIMDSRAAYSTLSPADKTTLHTAACTLGMLAYNINYLLAYQPTPANSPNLLTDLDQLIGALFTGSLPSGSRITTPPPFSTDSSRRIAIADATPEDVITALETWRDSAGTAGNPGDFEPLNRAVYTAQMLATREQVYYDLYYGFQSSRVPFDLPGSYCADWESTSNLNLLKLCSSIPHYPILFSLFPAFDLATTTPTAKRLVPRPTSHGDVSIEARTRDREDALIPEPSYISDVNGSSITLYRGIGVTDPSDPAAYPSLSSELSQIQIAPKPRGQWILPNQTYNGTSITPNNGQIGSGLTVLIRDCSSTTLACMDENYLEATPPSNRDLVRVAFKDSAFMNGRELMGVRALDMDLDLMRTSSDGLQNDFWLPKSGIIYAFREDAVSESNIVRPESESWSACSTGNALETDANCRMNTGQSGIDAYLSTDPPLNSTNLITPKPVDYYADPDRRPNGFRLRNGMDIRRNDDQGRGMTLVSDDPVYVQGDFNWHQTAEGRLLEEFVEELRPDYSNFYEGRSTPELAFANFTQDRWRPAEILADAITILSQNFCDGSIQDGIITATQSAVPSTAGFNRYGCLNGVTITSYFNQGRPNSVSTDPTTNNSWRRASKAESESYRPNEGGRTPLLVSRYGNPFVNQTSLSEYSGGYEAVTVDKLRNVAAETRVNATIVSGIVPSRRDQSYGGLHNFPRFLESWQRNNDNQIPLRIAGSFIQLNFSNYATGPFDQDAFEVGSTPLGGSSGGELINYYRPPNRFWGYDVGLQYAPAGPLARRFIRLENDRSEFYSEPPANDPYLYNLCREAAAAADRTPENSCTPP